MYDAIIEQIKEVGEILLEKHIETWNVHKLTKIKRIAMPPEIRSRIDVDGEICLWSSEDAYFISLSDDLLYAGDLIDNNALLSAVVDFNEREELMLLIMYILMNRDDLAKKLLAEPDVLMAYAAQI